MRRTLITGGLLALFAALLAQFGGILGLEEIRSALLGAAIGATLGLVPTTDAGLPRAVGFVTGFVLGWIGYALRAGVLPDSGSGRALAAFVVIAVLTGVCAATLGWMPLWAGLLGIAAIAGAYEYAFGIDPTAFGSQSVTAATTVLLAASVGFLVGGIGAAFVGDESEATRAARPPRRPDSDESGSAAPMTDASSPAGPIDPHGAYDATTTARSGQHAGHAGTAGTAGIEILDARPSEA